MNNTSIIYLKQRFPSKLFVSIALLLILYALRSVSLVTNHWKQLIYLFPLVLFLLLSFRIFDDLASRSEDREKLDRIYTQDAKVAEIQVLLGVSILISLGYTAFLIKGGFTPVILLFIIGLSPYFFQSFLGRFHFIIPLIKYPLLVLFIGYLLRFELIATDVFASITLFLACILYEMIEDQSIKASKKATRFAFWVLIGSFCFLMNSAMALVVVTVISSVFFMLFVWKPVKYLHFLILILVVILRIIMYEI